MSKVKLTREQAEAVERWADKDQLLIARATGLLNHGEDESIAELEINTLAKAIYIGYEVEPEFKVGDWVVRTVDMGKNHELGKIFKIVEINGENVYGERGPSHMKRSIRLATPEEITEEKQRRWWAKHGRKPWELRRNDLVSSKSGCSYTINLIKKDYVEFLEFGMSEKVEKIKESFKVICFAEDRKDVQA